MEPDVKRLFFAFEVQSPWPQELPQGRLLKEEQRHMTLAFLGNIPYDQLKSILPVIPKPTFSVGLAGCFDHCLFLPPRNPHVVAWNVEWLDDPSPMLSFQKNLVEWLQQNHFNMDHRPFLPHVTICRSPFQIRQWKEAFTPLPCILTKIHLYESIGNLNYEPIWSYPLSPPFEEIDHTADIAFRVYGENIEQLHHHALAALAFRHPQLLSLPYQKRNIDSLEMIIQDLNQRVSNADAESGCPLKAVSYHGNIDQESTTLLKWEMIVDV